MKFISGSMSFRTKVVAAMTAVGVLPLLVAGAVLVHQAETGLATEAGMALDGVSKNKAEQIQGYFDFIGDQATTLAQDPGTLIALKSFTSRMKRLSATFNSQDSLEAVDKSLRAYYVDQFTKRYESETENPISLAKILPQDPVARAAQYLYISNNPSPLGEKDNLTATEIATIYGKTHEYHHGYYREFQRRFGYYDVFLVDGESGRIVYSVFKELDYATSLKSGPYADSGIADVFRQAMSTGRTVFTDFARYTPSYEAAASFVAAPIRDQGKIIGTLIFQMPIDRINAILQSTAGLGDTGESVLVGSDGLMRSQSRFEIYNTILTKRVDLPAVSEAIDGRGGVSTYLDAEGNTRLANYQPVSAGYVNWALITSIDEAEATASASALLSSALIIMLLTGIAAATFALWFARQLNRQLGADPAEMVALAERIADGHIQRPTDQQVQQLSGAKRAIVLMERKLHDVLANAKRTSVQVNSGTAEIAAGNLGLSARTEEQASALQETAASTEEITATVRQNADHATEADKLAKEACQEAERGGQVVAEAVQAMAGIDESSERIVNIIGVIDEIAFQTNLLALNASVEAARAGEQGRGFAVVADEVRTLAGRSSKAAQEIRELIQESVNQVREGTQLVRHSGEALDTIVTGVSKTSQLVNDITQASIEQSAGIDQINVALSDMDAGTQQNAALVEEAAATAQAMHELAERLGEMLSYFKLDEDIDDSPVAEDPEPSSQT